MKKMIAIGGGENGRSGYPYETGEIDQEIVNLCEKIEPKILFIGTASNDHSGYFECIKRIFGENLNCLVERLNLLNETTTFKDAEQKILSSDIIYVGGGNTRKMLDLWKENNIDQLLQRAYEKGIVLSGLSAGSECWFKLGISDSDIIDGISNEYNLLEGLGFINALHCPHYNSEANKKEILKSLMKKLEEPIVAIAIDNCAAIEIIDDRYRIISSKKSANAYRTYWMDQIYYEEKIPKTKEYLNLNSLIQHPKFK